MNKTTKTKKHQIALVLSATALVVAGLWFVVIKAQSAKLEGVEKKTLALKDKVDKAEGLLKKEAEIEESLEADTAALELIEGGMASGDIYLWLINTLNRFSVAQKITFLDFQRELLCEVGALPKFPYKAAVFPVKGTAYYHDLGRFLAEFENSFPHVRVQNFDLVPSGKAGEVEAEKLNFKFEIVALIKPAGR